MEKDIERIELIEKYLKKSLSKTDLDNFEYQLKHDPILKAEVEIQKEIYLSIDIFGDREFKNELDLYHSEYILEKKRNRSNFKKITYASGTFAFFLILGLIFYAVNITHNKYKTPYGHREGYMSDTLEVQENDISLEENRKIIIPAPPENKTLIAKEIKEHPEKHYSLMRRFESPAHVISKVTTKMYFFDNSKLHVYGFEPDEIDIFEILQHNHEMFIKLKDDFYKISINEKIDPLIKSNDPNLSILNIAQGKGFEIEIVGHNAIIHEDKDDIQCHILEVRDLFDPNNNKYKFVDNELIINENLYNKLNNHFELYYVEEKQQYFLRHKNHLLELKTTSHNFEDLQGDFSQEMDDLFYQYHTKKIVKHLTLEDISPIIK